jgi:hypothetical protein
VTIWIALALAIDHVSVYGGFEGALAFVFLAGMCVVGTPVAIRLWRGTQSHETITDGPAAMSTAGAQAFAPSAIVSMDAMLIAFALLIFTGGEGGVARVLALGAGMLWMVLLVAGLCAAAFRRPRLLLPATLRAELTRPRRRSRR